MHFFYTESHLAIGIFHLLRSSHASIPQLLFQKHATSVVDAVTLVAAASVKTLQEGDTYNELLKIAHSLHGKVFKYKSTSFLFFTAIFFEHFFVNPFDRLLQRRWGFKSNTIYKNEPKYCVTSTKHEEFLFLPDC